MQNPFSALFDQWRAMVAQSAQALSASNAQTIQAVSEQFWAGQAQLLDLLRLTTDAWRTISANGATPTDWQQQLANYTEQMRQQLAATLESWQSTEQLAEAWQRYLQELQKF